MDNNMTGDRLNVSPIAVVRTGTRWLKRVRLCVDYRIINQIVDDSSFFTNIQSFFYSCFPCICYDNRLDPMMFCIADSCWTDMCLNGGTCVEDSFGVRCVCLPGSKGDRCEEGQFCLRYLLFLFFIN